MPDLAGLPAGPIARAADGFVPKRVQFWRLGGPSAAWDAHAVARRTPPPGRMACASSPARTHFSHVLACDFPRIRDRPDRPIPPTLRALPGATVRRAVTCAPWLVFQSHPEWSRDHPRRACCARSASRSERRTFVRHLGPALAVHAAGGGPRTSSRLPASIERSRTRGFARMRCVLLPSCSDPGSSG